MLFVTKPMSIDVAGAADEARRVTTHALERAGEMAADTSRKVRAGFEDARRGAVPVGPPRPPQPPLRRRPAGGIGADRSGRRRDGRGGGAGDMRNRRER